MRPARAIAWKNSWKTAFSAVSPNWRDHVLLDPGLLRPTDLAAGRGNPAKARVRLGWQARYRMRDVCASDGGDGAPPRRAVMRKRWRLAYLVSHPIQYQAPLLRLISAEPDIELAVFFCSDLSVRKYHDEGFGTSFQWDVPLLDGYRHEFLPTWSGTDRFSFWRPLNHGLARRLEQGTLRCTVDPRVGLLESSSGRLQRQKTRHQGADARRVGTASQDTWPDEAGAQAGPHALSHGERGRISYDRRAQPSILSAPWRAPRTSVCRAVLRGQRLFPGKRPRRQARHAKGSGRHSGSIRRVP